MAFERMRPRRKIRHPMRTKKGEHFTVFHTYLKLLEDHDLLPTPFAIPEVYRIGLHHRLVKIGDLLNIEVERIREHDAPDGKRALDPVSKRFKPDVSREMLYNIATSNLIEWGLRKQPKEK